MQSYASSSSSAQLPEPITEDFDSYEWSDMDFQEKMELLRLKKTQLDIFEHGVQEEIREHGWNEDRMTRATKDLFYYLRIIEKLEKCLNE